MNNDPLLKYLRLTLSITLITLALIIVPTLALISFSQSNDALSEEALSNESSFSSLSRELAENQSLLDDQTDQQPND